MFCTAWKIFIYYYQLRSLAFSSCTGWFFFWLTLNYVGREIQYHRNFLPHNNIFLLFCVAHTLHYSDKNARSKQSWIMMTRSRLWVSQSGWKLGLHFAISWEKNELKSSERRYFLIQQQTFIFPTHICLSALEEIILIFIFNLPSLRSRLLLCVCDLACFLSLCADLRACGKIIFRSSNSRLGVFSCTHKNKIIHKAAAAQLGKWVGIRRKTVCIFCQFSEYWFWPFVCALGLNNAQSDHRLLVKRLKQFRRAKRENQGSNLHLHRELKTMAKTKENFSFW